MSRIAFAITLVLGGLVGCSGDDSVMPPPLFVDAGDDTGPAPDTSAFPDGGIGTSTLAITRLAPDHGPFTGGTQVVIRGTGLNLDMEVSIGGRLVQPADMELIDSNRMAIVTPAGEVGPADVTLTFEDESVTLEGGYRYDSFYVDPSRGSVSGNTLVTITGTGLAFEDGDKVVFGRTECADLAVVSDSTMTCRTPPMAAGSLDVSLVRASDSSEIVVEDAYTYYDSTDPFGGGLGGGPIDGSLTVSVLNAMTGAPVPDAFVIVGEELDTPYQDLTDLLGQTTFSGDDIIGPLTIHAAKHCFERTSVVSFDARDVTIFLTPWMDPACGMGGGEPPLGRGRNGAFIAGELVWPSDFGLGPQPWFNIPDPRGNEVKVAYVFTTRARQDIPNPAPSLGGGFNRVMETSETGEAGYRYRIFARPAGLAVYALAGLENTDTGEFLPYVMGIARNVLAGPGEEVGGVNMVMDIPLDHVLDVSFQDLPNPARLGPDEYKVQAHMDLGGEGVIVREVIAPNETVENFDVVSGRNADRPFRFWAQPALYGAISDGRYRIEGGWYTGGFDNPPLTVVIRNGVRAVDEVVTLDGFLGIPQATSPRYGDTIPSDRILRWESDGEDSDLQVIIMTGGDGNPAWTHYVPGNVYEAPIPNLASIDNIEDISAGTLFVTIYAIKIPGFEFNEFSYANLNNRYWSHYAVDYFTAQQPLAP